MPNTINSIINAMDQATNEWTAKAARGECQWICSDCCITFPDGMPDSCPHGCERCSSYIKRDKANHAQSSKPA